MSCSKQILSENMEQDHQVDQVKVIPLASLRHCETWIAPTVATYGQQGEGRSSTSECGPSAP